jgi:hypothetical protein
MVGSLNGLAFALADAEQSFLVPSERQALIWLDLAPQIMIGAPVPRWWGVTPAEQHFVALHLRLGNRLLASSAVDAEIAAKVDPILRKQVDPQRLFLMRRLATQGQAQLAIEELTPSEKYRLATTFGKQHAADAADIGGPLWTEITNLTARNPEKFEYSRLAGVFGTPHPELSQSYRLELLHLPLFPTMMKFSSRILAESWESTNLYWAALADELHIAPSQLNVLIPEWTRQSIERIFATHLDDWPALLHSMRVVADRHRAAARSLPGEPLRAGQE